MRFQKTLFLFLLLGVLAAPNAACDEKKTSSSGKFSEIDLANLRLAASQMDNADQTFALAKRAMEDAQKAYADAMKRRDALLSKYGVKPEEMQSKTVTIGDDGTISRPPPPQPAKKK